MKKLEFNVRLQGKEGSSVAWLNAPFDVDKSIWYSRKSAGARDH